MAYHRSTQVVNSRGLAGRRRYGGWWQNIPRPQWRDLKKILKSAPKVLKAKILSVASQKGNQAVKVLTDQVRKKAGSAAGDLVGTLGGAAVNRVQKTIEKQVGKGGGGGGRGKKRPAATVNVIPAKKPKAARPKRRGRDIFGTFKKKYVH
jgi:hypothetical protein